MKEIEVKIKIDNVEPIIKKLAELGCQISEPVVQEDIIFNEKKPGSEGKIFLRVRKTRNKILFTLKMNVSDELDCIEKEIEINNSESMKDIIELLGYSEYTRVKKKRIKCNFKDYEICLDEVEGLGCFMEVEKISDEDTEIARKKMINFLESLEIDVSQRVFQGYDTLMVKKYSQKNI